MIITPVKPLQIKSKRAVQPKTSERIITET